MGLHLTGSSLTQLNNAYAAALTATAVKTGNYTATAGDLIPVDATSGVVTVTLPTAPTDRTRVAVKKIDASTNTVTVTRGGSSDVFNKAGGSTSLTLTLTNQAMSLQYSGGIWYVVGDDLPLSALDTRLNSAIDARMPTKGAVDLGASLTLLTDTARLAYTPGMGESVYATDTHLFYIGDGVTAGGVASDTGFSTDQLIRLGIIIPRHTRWLPAMQYAMTTGLTADIPKPLSVGNSITQGDGATAGLAGWRGPFGTKMATYTGIGTTHWQPNNVSVSGATISTMLSFLADYLDPTNFQLTKRSPILDQYVPKLTFVMEMRNASSFGWMTPGDYAVMLRACLGQVQRHDSDPVLFIENVQINATTGVPLDNLSGLQVTFDKYYRAGLRVAADMGASVVDAWAYYNLLYRLGVDLRPLINADGEHPNDAGYTLLAALAVACVTAPAVTPPKVFQDKPMTDGRSHAYASYAPNSGSPTAVSSGGFGTLQNSQSRASTLVQSGAARDVYIVASGGTITFRTPGPVRGFVVQYLLDPTNTGRAVVTMNGTSPTPQAYGNRWDGFASDGVTKQPNLATSITRQFDTYYSTFGAAAIDDIPGEVTITATGGQLGILGITFINGGVQSHPVWPDITNTGVAPVADTFADNSEIARRLTTAGDSDTLTFFGTSLGITFESGPNAGKYNISVDGAAAGSDVELWSTIGNRARKPATVAKNLALGWHTAKITVSATKNASSTGFDVKYGRVHSERGTPDTALAYVPLASGETATLTERWKFAQIDKVISGTPVVQFTPGASTITLGATGAAWVRLTR